jgi:hypothetical protein
VKQLLKQIGKSVLDDLEKIINAETQLRSSGSSTPKIVQTRLLDLRFRKENVNESLIDFRFSKNAVITRDKLSSSVSFNDKIPLKIVSASLLKRCKTRTPTPAVS